MYFMEPHSREKNKKTTKYRLKDELDIFDRLTHTGQDES